MGIRKRVWGMMQEGRKTLLLGFYFSLFEEQWPNFV